MDLIKMNLNLNNNKQLNKKQLITPIDKIDNSQPSILINKENLNKSICIFDSLSTFPIILNFYFLYLKRNAI